MKICKSCKIEKPISSFYKCQGMKDGHFNICKECFNIQGQKYRRKKSLDINWVIANRERRKKYPQSKRHPFPEIQPGHIWQKYRDKISIIPRYQFHHWNYNFKYSVFYIHPSIHSKFHTLAKLNVEEKIYYFANIPLKTKEEHFKILDWVNKHFEYNYQIIEYELDKLTI